MIGRSLVIEGKPFSIVGVMPPRFFGLTVGLTDDIYLPLAAEPYIRGKDSLFPNHVGYWLMAFGRLRPGLTLEQGRARLEENIRRNGLQGVIRVVPAALSDREGKATMSVAPETAGNQGEGTLLDGHGRGPGVVVTQTTGLRGA